MENSSVPPWFLADYQDVLPTGLDELQSPAYKATASAQAIGYSSQIRMIASTAI